MKNLKEWSNRIDIVYYDLIEIIRKIKGHAESCNFAMHHVFGEAKDCWAVIDDIIKSKPDVDNISGWDEMVLLHQTFIQLKDVE